MVARGLKAENGSGAIVSDAPTRRHLLGLDLVRIMAALMVAVFHLGFAAGRGELSYPRLLPGAWFGWIGVEVFFVISGYVITYSARGSAVDFVRARLLRLMPALWICTSITLAVLLTLGGTTPAEIGPAYLRSMILFPYRPWLDGSVWSLCVEVVFYASIALTLARRSSVVRTLVVIGWISAVFHLFVVTALLGPGPEDIRAFTLHLSQSWSASITLLSHGCFFALGGLFHALSTGRRDVSIRAATGVCALAGLAEVAVDGVMNFAGYSWQVADLGVLIGVALIVLAVRHNEWVWTVCARHARLIRRLGLATYPFYLLHQEIGKVLMKTAQAWGAPDVVSFVLALILTAAGALVISVWLEPVVRGGLDRTFGVAPWRLVR